MRKKKKNKKIKRIVLISIISICILFGITANLIGDKRNLNFFEKIVKDTVTTTQKLVNVPIKSVKNLIRRNKNNKEYDKLKEEVDKTNSYIAEIEELKKERDELKSTLDLNATLSEYSVVNATVVNRNIGYWYNNLTIDKGSKSGIKNGDAVITSKGLIGKVVSVSNYSSTVKLLTSDEIKNKISVKISNEDSFYYGLLIGYDDNRKVYKIEGVSDIDKISNGDMVTTTGLTESFPGGLLIGYVSNIVKDEYDLTAIVEVKPSATFQDISIVTVIKREAKEK